MVMQMQHSLVARPAFLQKTDTLDCSAGGRYVVEPALVTGAAQIELASVARFGPYADSFVFHGAPPIIL